MANRAIASPAFFQPWDWYYLTTRDNKRKHQTTRGDIYSQSQKDSVQVDIQHSITYEGHEEIHKIETYQKHNTKAKKNTSLSALTAFSQFKEIDIYATASADHKT